MRHRHVHLLSWPGEHHLMSGITCVQVDQSYWQSAIAAKSTAAAWVSPVLTAVISARFLLD